MRFSRIRVTFGNLNDRELRFAPGLNVIEAENESGKSTLSAALRAMLYGVPTSARGDLAEKNRYAPWSGAAMRGILELTDTAYGDITLTRDTANEKAPMGSFSATYTGTGDTIDALTNTGCGEALLGISRNVYERSAFIGQHALPVSTDAELEQRISALLSTGEEEVSYTATNDILKKQLNKRKHNKTGAIPALEQEIAQDRETLQSLRSLQHERQNTADRLTALTALEQTVAEQIARHERIDRYEQAQKKREAGKLAETAETQYSAMRDALQSAGVPEQSVLQGSRSAIEQLGSLQAQVEEAKRKRDAAQEALRQMEEQLQNEAKSSLHFGIKIAIAVAAIAVIATSAVLSLPFLLLLLVPIIAGALFAVQQQKRAHAQAVVERRKEPEAALKEAESGYTVLSAALEKQTAEVLAPLHAESLAAAKAYVDEHLAQYKQLEQKRREAEDAKLRYQSMPEVADAPETAEERPARSRAALESEQAELARQCAEAQTAFDRADGQLGAAGEADELEARLHQKEAQRDALQAEYDAIALAMDALTAANTVLQNRFSPALGARASELLSAMTDGRYCTVTLNREMNALATTQSDPIARKAELLSHGTSDQLYLAVRLAICDLVLPQEQSIPLVLDDALVDFDDKRCQAALELLLSASKDRQILLLSCQHREAAYLDGRDGVTSLTL